MAKKHYVLNGPVPTEPENNTADTIKVLDKHKDDSTEVACIMLATISSEFTKGLEDLGAHEMLEQLKVMFQKQARQERFETMKQLIISCRMEQGSSVSAHVKMKGYIDQLKKLDDPLSDEMAADFILNSLPISYDQFTMDFNMNSWVTTMSELHATQGYLILDVVTTLLMSCRSLKTQKKLKQGSKELIIGDGKKDPVPANEMLF
ncbi:uncharacterized protein LOC143624916 [Bidens hawaiensis]|uniref:uncharacterized protein LOC143624916 n=1 Tax=Bidens hawaiensis TaxID=980011 RepID=UPI00404A4011